MKIKSIFVCAAIMGVIAACSKDETPVQERKDKGVFTASVEANDLTRTSLGAKEGEAYPTLWVTGDAVAVTNGADTGKYSTQQDGTESATFTFVSGADVSNVDGSVYAYYPYDGFVSHTGDEFNVTLPSVQSFRSENIDNGSYPMVAVSGNKNLVFRNVCGIIRLKLSTHLEGLSIVSIEVTAGAPLSGSATVVYSGGDAPALLCTGSGKVVLECGAGVELGAEAVDFHIMLPPSSPGYEGLAFKVTFTDGRVQTFVSNIPIKVERSCVTTVSLTADHPVIPARATLKSGNVVNAALKTLAAGSSVSHNAQDVNVKSVVFVTGSVEPRQNGETEIQDLDSDYPIYAGWNAQTGTVTIRTSADMIASPANMSRMFYYLAAMTSIDVTGLDTSQTTDMSYMFGMCKGLASLDLTTFDTSKVTSMEGMFSGNYAVTSIDISSFDTSKVMKFEGMFNGDSLLSSLNLGPRFVFAEGVFFHLCSLIRLPKRISALSHARRLPKMRFLRIIPLIAMPPLICGLSWNELI